MMAVFLSVAGNCQLDNCDEVFIFWAKKKRKVREDSSWWSPRPTIIRPMDVRVQNAITGFAPNWSEYMSEDHIRHSWYCENCGHQFETSEYLPFETMSVA